MTSGAVVPSFAAASRALSAAAFIMSAPPEVWIVSIHAPSAAAERTEPLTWCGMSWNFRSRKTR